MAPAVGVAYEGDSVLTHTVPSEDRVLHEDPQLAHLLALELSRQEETLELIPSENLAPPAVLQALGSWLNNKYAEGVPGKRYYGGCEVVDQVEDLARQRACALFGADHANVQPHSGSQANMAVYQALLNPGDRVLGMALDHGGHLTHGAKVSFSGKLYDFHSYTVSEKTSRVEYDEVQARAEEVKPKLIVAGYSAYPRILDWAQFAKIAHSVGALLMVDMAHIAGLVAGGVHPSPVPYADVVTFTTHKTLRGPWGGMILCKEEFADRIDKAVCPGIQGGPQLHAIAAKAVMLHLCTTAPFAEYAQSIISNARMLADELMKRDITLVSGGTDNHLMLVDLRPLGITGRTAQQACDVAGVTLNANTFPYHGGTPFNPNGIRLGTPSITSRGMRGKEMVEIADILAHVLHDGNNTPLHEELRQQTRSLCRRFPLPYRA